MNALLAVIAVLGVASSGPIMAATAAPALAIAFWRNLFGASVMAVPVLTRGRARLRGLRLKDFRWTVLAGVALALHFACFITALKLTSVAAATALVCLQAGWVVLIQLAFKQRQPPAVYVGLLAALAGVFVITGFDVGTSSTALAGDVLGLAGGLLAAVYTLAGAKARESLTTGVYTSACYVLCAVILLVLSVVFGESLVVFPPVAWIGIIGVTIAAQIFGHTVFNHLLAVLPPLTVSMLILLEIPGAAILAAIFLHEVLPAGIYQGLLLILAGLAIVVGLQGRSLNRWVQARRSRRDERRRREADGGDGQ